MKARQLPALARLQALADNLASVSSRHPKAREALRAAIGSAVLTNKNGVTGALVTPSILL